MKKKWRVIYHEFQVQRQGLPGFRYTHLYMHDTFVYIGGNSTPGAESMPGVRSVSAEKSLNSSRAVWKE